MYKYVILTFLILTSCSKENLEFNVPTTSEVEKLIKHSDEFNQEVITFDTPGGKIHFAIGFGIANSIMVEGQDGNIIIDAADSRYDAEKIYELFRKKNSNPVKAIIYTHNHGDHTFGAAYYLDIQDNVTSDGYLRLIVRQQSPSGFNWNVNSKEDGTFTYDSSRDRFKGYYIAIRDDDIAKVYFGEIGPYARWHQTTNQLAE